MTTFTKADIKKKLVDEHVGFIRVMFTDVFGIVKNVEITSSQVDELLENNLLFDGSSIDGFVRLEESDMYLYPDLDTFKVLPESMTGTKYFADGDDNRVAMIVADVYTSDRIPFEGDPRFRLKTQLKAMKDAGFDSFNVGVEPEFFLFKADEKGGIVKDHLSRPAMELNDKGGYFDLAPLDLGENVRREIVLTLEKLGFQVEAAHHEVAPGQHEVDFQYTDALHAADNIQIFKLIVKTIARKNGYYATFMPKPIAGINGNGMHVNMSLFNGNDNVFEDSSDDLGLSQTAYAYIAGLLEHAEGFTAITNPTVNSYKRLIPGYEAPVHVAWSASNRSPMIRIPLSRGKATRIELRTVDPTANPYLAIAAILASGLDGIEKKLVPEHSIDQNIFQMDDEERSNAGIKDLPETLLMALKALKKDEVVVGSVGRHLIRTFIEAKKAEYASFRQSVSEWEIEEYLELF